ncbi:uncharacterized protein LOC114283844 [Camellia sinensis]|uniref:uncharacterized protein LOC114283844 n=1 Tax=Camellia sinensis TaxID=4442 RepID=UPI0010364B5F|nr:uncharacterized protein LOC114283844 [Camellia sinensis]
MKLLSWNIRGLGNPEKRRKLKELLRARKVDIVLIQETKKAEISESFVRSLWPGDQMEFMAVDAVGNAGGLLCIWKPEVFSLSDCCCSKNFILLSGITSLNFSCIIVNVYASNDLLKRRRLWELLCTLRTTFTHPWCIGGDFNEVKSIGERKGCVRRDVGMKDLGNFIDKIGGVDLPMLGRRYTWGSSQDGDRWSRIDRFILNPEWLESFRFKLWGLPRSLSDHCPLLLMEDERVWGPKPFRFINSWAMHTSFYHTVKQNWEHLNLEGWAGYILKKKLQALKLCLTKWNKEVFGNIKENLQEKEAELH